MIERSAPESVGSSLKLANTKGALSSLQNELPADPIGHFLDRLTTKVDGKFSSFVGKLFGEPSTVEAPVALDAGTSEGVSSIDTSVGTVESASKTASPQKPTRQRIETSDKDFGYQDSLMSILRQAGIESTGKPKKDFFLAAQVLAKQEAAAFPHPEVMEKVILAQALLESGCGQSELTQKACNCFGVKALKEQAAVAMGTREGKNGEEQVRSRFAFYPDLQSSFADHGRLLKTSRYERVLGATDLQTALKTLGQCGYYTLDPALYTSRAVNVLNSFETFIV